MRIHFTDDSRPHPFDIARAALAKGHDLGTIAKHVGFKVITQHRTSLDGFAYALEIQLDAQVRDRGRRAGNGGSYGASEDYAATYDEWGHFLSYMYQMDEAMRCQPNAKRDTAHYYDAADFHDKTGRTYDIAYPSWVEERGDDFMYLAGRNQIGRRGYGRVHYDSTAARYAKEDERTADWLRRFQAGQEL